MAEQWVETQVLHSVKAWWSAREVLQGQWVPSYEFVNWYTLQMNHIDHDLLSQLLAIFRSAGDPDRPPDR
jgi:hypothetical protein